jgi:universal stress protein F
MYHHVLVAVALDHIKESHQSFNVARALQARDGLITALHVLEEVPSYASQYLPQDFVRKHVTQERDAFEELLLHEEGVTPVLINGHAGRSIVEYAHTHDVDCIIVASHRPELQDYLLGSTAARVVRHANCAVHVLR